MSTRRRAIRESLIRETRHFLAEAILFNQQLADRLGINAIDYQVLNLLDLFGPATPGDLAQLTGLSSGGMTVVIDRLEHAHYIERERNPRDRRSVIVRFAAAPKRRIAMLYKPVLALMDKVLAAYDVKQLGVINDFFMRSNRAHGPAQRKEPGRKRVVP
jgi:DNA-binding MarR family transcriptional regulator